MKIFDVSFNDYYHTAQISLKKTPFILYYLYNFTMWLCDRVPSIYLPRIKYTSPKGYKTDLRCWFGDTQQLFHIYICAKMFNLVEKHTKYIDIPLPYPYLKDLFPDNDKTEWDKDDDKFRQLSKELSRKHNSQFKELQKKMYYTEIQKDCNPQIKWYNSLNKEEL